MLVTAHISGEFDIIEGEVVKTALQTISDKLAESLPWLRHGWGAVWALLVLFIVSLVLLILAARAQGRSRD